MRFTGKQEGWKQLQGTNYIYTFPAHMAFARRMVITTAT